ncbi:MAG: Enamidase, partial [Mesorhizobium sp.]
SRALEIVHNGNLRTGLFVLELARQRGELSRVILGTDSPAGSGVQPLGILRTLTMLASLGGIAPEVAFCLASGNTARVRGLADRGIIEVGRAADLIFIDQAIGGAGDGLLDSVALGNLPGIGMVIIDGEVRTNRSRNTPPAMRVPEVRAA